MSGWRNRSTYDHGGVSSPCATVGLERGTLRFSVPSSPRAGASLRNPKCDAFRDATSLVTARHVTDRHRATPRLTPMHSSGASGFLISGLGAIALPLRDPQCHPVILRSGNLGTEGPFKSGRPDHFPRATNLPKAILGLGGRTPKGWVHPSDVGKIGVAGSVLQCLAVRQSEHLASVCGIRAD